MHASDNPTSGRRHSSGSCHRCGWRGDVLRVGRPDRKLLGTGRKYGRLCDDCYNELRVGPHALAAARTPRHPHLRSVRDRDVA